MRGGNAAVRDEVLEAVRSGRLPDRSAERTWAGRGCGAPCEICGRSVSADELEYELEFVSREDGKEPARYHLHNGCFWAWESERRMRELERRAETNVVFSGADTQTTLTENDCEAPGSQGSS
jgi:hypothetical protein